jgi:hypothetical protein
MDPLFIEGTGQTPTVKFDGDHGFIEIKGKSSPENAIGFYKQLYEWVDDYIKAPAQFTHVHVRLEYFNTSSSKCILNLLKKFVASYEAGHSVNINWYYEKGDADMLEAAKDYESLIDAPFNIIETLDFS